MSTKYVTWEQFIAQVGKGRELSTGDTELLRITWQTAYGAAAEQSAMLLGGWQESSEAEVEAGAEPGPERAPQAQTSLLAADPVERPWLAANPRIVSGYNVRMKQPLMEKVRWIVDNAPGRRSIQTLAVAAIEAECDRILKDMGIEA
jgi:hypothetical protein